MVFSTSPAILVTVWKDQQSGLVPSIDLGQDCCLPVIVSCFICTNDTFKLIISLKLIYSHWLCSKNNDWFKSHWRYQDLVWHIHWMDIDYNSHHTCLCLHLQSHSTDLDQSFSESKPWLTKIRKQWPTTWNSCGYFSLIQWIQISFSSWKQIYIQIFIYKYLYTNLYILNFDTFPFTLLWRKLLAPDIVLVYGILKFNNTHYTIYSIISDRSVYLSYIYVQL